MVDRNLDDNNENEILDNVESPFFEKDSNDINRQNAENRLSHDDNEDTEDTQTRSNIHLSTEFGDGTGESDVPVGEFSENKIQNSEFNGTNYYNQSENSENIELGNLHNTHGSQDIDAPSKVEVNSSGRSTSQIEINTNSQNTENNNTSIDVPESEAFASQESTQASENDKEARNFSRTTEKENSSDAEKSNEEAAVEEVSSSEDTNTEETLTSEEEPTNISLEENPIEEATPPVEENASNVPESMDDAVSGAEDSVLSGNVLTNDSDIDGDSLSVQSTGTFDTDHGSITINADGSFEYTPDADYNGADSFEYTVTDNNGGTDTATINFTVNAENDAPVINNVKFEEFGNNLSLNVDGNSGDVAVLSELDDFPTEAITVRINFNSDTPPDAIETNGVSLVSYATPDNNNEFLLFAEPNGGFSAYINGARNSLDLGDNNLFDGENHDLTVSWNSVNGEVSIYVDGDLTDTSTTSIGTLLTTGGTLVLGQEQDSVGGGFASNQEFSGEINSLEVYSKVLDAEEINAITDLPSENNPVLGFDFTDDEPLSNFAGDHSFVLDGGAHITNFDEGTIEEDSEGINGQISANDVDGDDLTYSIIDEPDEGSVSIEADGTFHFTPGNDFQDLGVGDSREVSFEVQVSDGNGGVDTQSVTVTVVGQNDGPSAETLTVQTDEESNVTGQLVASDIDGDNLTFSMAEQPSEGLVSINADGSFSFSPENDFQDLGVGESRETSFSYQVSDNNGGTSVETVTITVNGTNDVPVIGNITNAVGSQDEAESIASMAMSFNEDGRSGDVAIAENLTDFPTEEITVELRFSSTEAPNPSDTNGTSLFSYNVAGSDNEFLLFSDSSGSLGVYINGQRTLMDVDMDSLFDGDYHHLAVSWDSNNGEISVYVDGDLEDTATAQAGKPINTGGTMTLGQEQDSLGGGFATNQQFSGKIADVQIFNEVRDAELVETDANTGGTVSNDNSLIHAFNFNHSDDNSVINQGVGNDLDYSGSIIVEDSELPAQVGDVELIALEDNGAVTGSLNANDVEGDDLSFSLVEGSTEGTVSISDDGQFTFDPGSDFQDLGAGETREVSFTYQVDDGNGGIESATETVTVLGSNDGPVATIDTVIGSEDSVLSGNVLTNDSDIDGDSLSVQNAGTFDTDHGSIIINGDGSFDYTPDANYNGADSFEYTVTDSNGGTDTATINFTVNAENDGPVAVVDAASGAEDSVLSGNVLTNDSDIDGDSLSVQNTGTFDTDHGSITINGDGSFDYTPDADYNGADSFEVTVTDGTATTTSTLNFTVTEVVDPVTTTIDINNFTATDQGFSVAAQNIVGGELTTATASNVSTYGSGFGAGGTVSDTDSGVMQQIAYDQDSGQSEQLVVSFDNEVSSADFSFANLYTASYGEQAHWQVFDNGVLVDEGDFTTSGYGGSGTVEIDPGQTFDQLVFTGLEQSDGSDGSDFMITEVNFTYTPDNKVDYSADNTPSAPIGHDVMDGGNGKDTMNGSSENEFMSGGNGVDTIDGGAGDDVILGGNGKDDISGGDGDDVLYGESANDTIDGGAGNDVIIGGEGNDVLTGGDGDDTLTFLAHQGSDVVDGGSGGSWTDTLQLDGFDGQTSQDGWTLNLDNGSAVVSTDEEIGEIILSGDAGGTITFDDGGAIDFENIEKIVW